MISRIVRALHNGLLRLLPRALHAHRQEMAAAFDEMEQAARARHGALGSVAVLLRDGWDLLVTSVNGRVGRGHAATPVPSITAAARSVARRPGLGLAVASVVAVSVAGATVVFALADGVLLRPLPYPEPGRLVNVFQTNPELGWERGPVSLPNFDDWRRQAEVFQEMGAVQMGLREIVSREDGSRVVLGSRVTGGLFATLGVAPELGRVLDDDDMRVGAPAVAVLGHHLWQELFGGDPDLVGRTVELGGEPTRVVGIMPASFPALFDGEDFWVPLRQDPADADRGTNFLTVFGRLKAGATVAEAGSYMAALSDRIIRVSPEGNEGREVRVESRDAVVRGNLRTPFLLLLASGLLLLVVAAANLAALHLVRGVRRRTELSIRMALGAERRALSGQLTAEWGWLCAVGTLAAIPLGHLALDGVLSLTPPRIPGLDAVALGGRAIGFALIAGALLVVASGWIPARRIVRSAGRDVGVASALRQGSVAATRPQRLLMVFQVAVAAVLLVGTALLVGSARRLAGAERGFDSQGVLTFQVVPPPDAYREPEELDAFYTDLLDALGTLPGVDHAGATWALPLGTAFGSTRYGSDGYPEGQDVLVQMVPERGDYLAALGIPLLRGRALTAEDGRDGQLAAMVNESLARRLWPDGEAVGHELRKGSGEDAVHIPVVGVVADVVMQSLGERPSLQAFFPHSAVPWARELYVALRTGGDPLALVPSVRAAVDRVDERVGLAGISTMGGRVDAQLAGPRFRAYLAAGFGGLAAVLVVAGLFGLTAFTVAARTREIGVRMALGAGRRGVLLAVLREGLAMTGLGVVIGLLLARSTARLVSGLLFGVTAGDPAIYAGVAVGVVVVTALACGAPAYRASRVPPTEALRDRGSVS